MPGRTLYSLLLLAVGLCACASSVIFIKASQLQPVLLCTVRLWIAVLVLLPVFVRDLRRARGQVTLRRVLGGAWLPGSVLALHFITWVIGARLTPALNASLIVNLIPVVTPIWLLLLFRRGISRAETLGSAIALGGVLLLEAGNLALSSETARGDAVCFLAMILFALYLVLGQRQRASSSLWLYVVPLYAYAALVCSLASLVFEAPMQAAWTAREAALALALGVIPTVIGHSILNRSIEHMSAQLVGIANLSQPAFAALLAFLFLRETPDPQAYVAAAVVLAGVIVALRTPSSAAAASAPHSR